MKKKYLIATAPLLLTAMMGLALAEPVNTVLRKRTYLGVSGGSLNDYLGPDGDFNAINHVYSFRLSVGKDERHYDDVYSAFGTNELKVNINFLENGDVTASVMAVQRADVLFHVTDANPCSLDLGPSVSVNYLGVNAGQSQTRMGATIGGDIGLVCKNKAGDVLRVYIPVEFSAQRMELKLRRKAVDGGQDVKQDKVGGIVGLQTGLRMEFWSKLANVSLAATLIPEVASLSGDTEDSPSDFTITSMANFSLGFEFLLSRVVSLYFAMTYEVRKEAPLRGEGSGPNYFDELDAEAGIRFSF